MKAGKEYLVKYHRSTQAASDEPFGRV